MFFPSILAITLSLVTADQTPVFEIPECAGSDTQTCCQELVRYVVASNGELDTVFEPNTPKYYWPVETFFSQVDGRNGFEFGCASWDKHLLGTEDSFGEVWPLFLRCLPGQVQSKGRLYHDQVGECVNEVDESSHNIDWKAVRHGLQRASHGVPRIKTLYKKFEAMKQHTEAWKAERSRIYAAQNAVEKQWEDLREQIAEGTVDDNCEASQENCMRSLGWQTQCLDLVPSLSLGESRRTYDPVELYGNTSRCNYKECLRVGLLH